MTNNIFVMEMVKTQFNMETSERKIGEMFTSSALKKITPKSQFIFTLSVSVAFMLAGRYMESNDLIIYSGSFGLVFFVLWNPWLALLAEDNKRYFVYSAIAYLAINVILFGLMYLWTGVTILHSAEMGILLFSTIFYGVVSYLTMLAIKVLFLDLSGGGL